jgi:hypothetical protein
VAAGLSGKRVVVAVVAGVAGAGGAGGGLLTPWYYQKRGPGSPGAAYPNDTVDGAFQSDASPSLQPFLAVGGASFLQDAGGALFRLTEPPQGRSLERLARRAAAVAVISGQLVFVEPVGEDGGPARIATVAGHAPPATAVTLEGPGETAFFGYGGKIAHPEHGLAAVEHPGGSWEVLSARGRSFLTPFAGNQVMGIVRDAQRGEPGLLLLDEDRRTLVIAGLSWIRKLAPAGGEIVQAAASPGGPHVAYVTVSGEIVVTSLDHDAPLFRHIPEGGA